MAPCPTQMKAHSTVRVWTSAPFGTRNRRPPTRRTSGPMVRPNGPSSRNGTALSPHLPRSTTSALATLNAPCTLYAFLQGKSGDLGPLNPLGRQRPEQGLDKLAFFEPLCREAVTELALWRSLSFRSNLYDYIELLLPEKQRRMMRHHSP